jgi:hypothetical protein
MRNLGLLLFSLAMSIAVAQNSQINGVITDSSGALVPQATAAITNQDTGVKRTVTSNEDGYYSASALSVGKYQIVVSATGFQPASRDGVKVEVGQQVRLDFELRPGSMQETVEVHADVAELNREQAEFGTALEEKMVTDLPLELSSGLAGQAMRRQIDNFSLLVPGATGSGFSHRFNGGVDMANEVFYNGVPFVFSETQGWQQNSNPPYDSVNEFKVVTSVFTAQYGHGQGVANYNFTSGTNGLHGNLHEYVRNNVFDARSFFSPSVSINRQNEYGFNVGGPVWIPKVYNGKNKTFFDFTYSGYKFRGAPLTGLQTVPTQAMRTGDFSGLVDSSGNTIPIYDPASGTNNRTQFPNNTIPGARIGPVAAALTALIPLPAYPGLVNNIGLGITSIPIDDNTWSFRLDHNFSDRQQLSYTMWKDSDNKTAVQDGNITGPLGGFTLIPEKELGGVLNYSYTIRANLIMTTGVSYNGSLNPQYHHEFDNTVDIPGVPKGSVFPLYSFSGPVAAPVPIGTGSEGGLNRKVGVGFVHNYLWLKGKNSFNIGLEARRPYQNNSNANSNSFNFTNETTSLPGSPNYTAYGSPFASFLLGLADSATIQGPYALQPRSWYAAGYLQDDFKVSPKLTLNLGVRYDIFVPFTEKNNNIVYFDPTAPNPGAGGIPGALEKLGTCSVGCAGTDQIATTHGKYIAPRIGFAYSLNKKTVLRGGYGIVYLNGGASEFGTNKVVQGYFNGLTAQAIYTSPNSGVTPGYGSIDNPIPVLATPTFSPSAGNGQNVNYLAPYNGQVPYLQNWTIGVQREVPGGIVLSAAYVGNHAVRLPSALQNLNQVNPKYLSLGGVLLDDINSPQAQAAGIQSPYPGFVGGVAQALRPYPQYQGITSNFDEAGASEYKAFQITAQKRYSQGLTFLVSYAASRMMSNNSSGFSTFNAAPINTFNRKAEWSIDPNDVPNSLHVAGTYELPIGHGKKFLSALPTRNPANYVLGGWQFGWVMSYSSGSPVSFGANNVLPLYNGGNRPNVVSGVNPCLSKSGFDPAKNVMFNLAAFSQPADYTFGNAPRAYDSCLGFPSYDEDVNLSKYFKFTEKLNLQFRAEFFNVFNRVVFSGGNSSYSPGNQTFGLVSGQANNPRTGQIGLKLNF